MKKEVLSIFGRILSEEDKSSVLEILTTTPVINPDNKTRINIASL
jgi:hypothetical protein